MPWVGFEPTIPVFEREKTVHALDRAATVSAATDKGKRKMREVFYFMGELSKILLATMDGADSRY
jgi:hypothetical protein